jgi:hypothetical protein
MGIRPEEATPARGRLLRALAAALMLALACGACREPDAVAQPWPPGDLLVARTDALRRLLGQLEAFEGTRIARHAGELRKRLPDCEHTSARAMPGADAPVPELRCFDPAGDLAPLDRLRGNADLVFALAGAAGERTAGTLTLSADGEVDAQILLPESRFDSARALLLPDREAAGPLLLSRSDELVHARLRPEGGLDIASLVPASSQADRMFRLKSELFAGAVLDGTWEAAIYLPEPGRPMPRAALAVGFSFREPAIAAMERFLEELRSTWPVRRSDFALGDATGACLLELKVMPDFAPCYVATGSALVIGWNAASLRKAIAHAAPPETAEGADVNGHALTVELSRIPEADARFAALEAEAKPLATTLWPWRRLTADGRREGDAVRVRVRLDGGAGA